MKVLSVVAFLCLAQVSLSKSVTSYEGFKVLRVNVVDRQAADTLHQLVQDSAEFW